ncbi:hypothetical protein AB0J57_06610 [Streptomyces sp. NPDC049837]|uniref:hypothetical protein n=1 Tax=Streptomyces sp. NPDC049837 TaxID=3155277 RepID=UPI00342F378A
MGRPTMGRQRRPVTPMGLAGTAVTMAALTLMVRGRRGPRPAPSGPDAPRKRWMPLLLIPSA